MDASSNKVFKLMGQLHFDASKAQIVILTMMIFCHAVGPDAVYCLSLCYFGIDVTRNDLLGFQSLLRDFSWKLRV